MNQSAASPNRLYSIDGLKGVSACIIAFCWHYQHFSPQEGFPFYRLFELFYLYGYLMVEVFFMLSGFGMALGYEKKIQNDSLSFTEYMLKRLKRLFPLMLITLIITTIFQYIYFQKTAVTFQYPDFDVYHFLLNLFGLQSGILELEYSFNAPSWCISILLCCYAVFFFAAGKRQGNNVPLLKYMTLALGGGNFRCLKYELPSI